MDAGISTALGDILIIVLMVAGLLAPLVLLVGLIWLAVRHLRGRRTRFDGLFGGIGRAAQMNSHLRAGTPHPDDLAVPVPPRPRHPPRDV